MGREVVLRKQNQRDGDHRWQKDGVYIHFSATDIYQRRINKPMGYGSRGCPQIVSKVVPHLRFLHHLEYD